jgi:thiol-disulfide isomerase/thioredoxin
MTRSLLAVLLLTACASEPAAPAPAPSEPPARPGERPRKPMNVTRTRPAVAETYRIVDLPATDNPRHALVAEVDKQFRDGFRPFLYFSAGWCEPCKSFKKHMKDPRILDALQGVALIVIDVDLVPAAALEYKVKAVPVWMEVNRDAQPTGRKITGEEWKEDVPANMAPVMKKFFAGG